MRADLPLTRQKVLVFGHLIQTRPVLIYGSVHDHDKVIIE
jgi:hypothetical protein